MRLTLSQCGTGDNLTYKFYILFQQLNLATRLEEEAERAERMARMAEEEADRWVVFLFLFLLLLFPLLFLLLLLFPLLFLLVLFPLLFLLLFFFPILFLLLHRLEREIESKMDDGAGPS